MVFVKFITCGRQMLGFSLLVRSRPLPLTSWCLSKRQLLIGVTMNTEAARSYEMLASTRNHISLHNHRRDDVSETNKEGSVSWCTQGGTENRTQALCKQTFGNHRHSTTTGAVMCPSHARSAASLQLWRAPLHYPEGSSSRTPHAGVQNA
jgi:hypothetical protein